MSDSKSDDLSSTLTRNIDSIEARRRQAAQSASRQDRVVGAITRFAGSLRFVYLHLAFYCAWILAASGLLPGVQRFDRSFTLLAMMASVEAIFLSTFVLISQNRNSLAADKRADLNLHMTLLTEHELTKLTGMVAAIAARLDVPHGESAEIEEVKRDVAPAAVLDALDARRA